MDHKKRILTVDNFTKLIRMILILISFYLNSQTAEWQNTIGGSDYEWCSSMELTSDGNYILGGYSMSNISGDKNENSRGGSDYFIIKIDDNTGNVLWQKTIGGSLWDRGTSIKGTKDRGYIIGGYSNSNKSSEKSENSRGGDDYWVVKLDANRNVVWDKTYGGSGLDRLFSIIETDDGGYLMGGESDSNISGEKSENSRGITDMWVIKIDKNGLIEWQKTYGGNQRDRVNSIVKAKDGYILAGSSQSNISGEKTENLRDNGFGDYWVLKIDKLGNIIWQRTIGGDNGEGADYVLATSDGNYIIGGNSMSTISGEKTESPICNSIDVWLVKLDENGNILWDKTIGGNSTESIGSIRETNDNGLVLGVMSYSDVSGHKTEPSRGDRDYWLVKLDKFGNTEFEKTLGGSDLDQLTAVVQSNDGSYVLSGWSLSNTSHDKNENSNGLWDYWVIKLKMEAANYSPASYSEKSVCDGSHVNLTANLGVSYNWSGPNGFSSKIQNPTLTNVSSLKAGIYNVVIHDASGCATTKIINVKLEGKPIVNSVNNIVECDNDNDGFTDFNLSNLESQILGSQTNLIATFYDGNGNELLKPLSSSYVNRIVNQEDLTIRVARKDDLSCFNELSLKLQVNPCQIINIPPNIIATGDQDYCPSSQINIVSTFDIIDPDDTEIDAFYIQISTGYSSGVDRLILNGTHPNIVASWNVAQGKMSLGGIGGLPVNYADIIAAVKSIVFVSNMATQPGDKLFSFTIGNANFLPSTGHFYEYVPALGITWTDAKAAAELRTYFGLQGYLATISSKEEAQLSGEQAAGAGWIGGSDAQTEGVWKWMTGPETGTVFWNGGINGSTPNFANWNRNEPNNVGDEDYAHVTAPGVGIAGSWNDLENTGKASGDYQPKGYIVEYGGAPGDPPLVDISASTKINIPSIVNVEKPTEICGSGSATLKATASSGDVVWFDVSTGGTPLFTDSAYSTPIINTSTSYFVMASVNGCLEGARTKVTVTVNPIPIITSITENTICDGDSGTLSAAASVGIISWYSVPSGGTAIATGTSFTSPKLTNTTTYYVEATNNGCKATSRTSVTLTVQKTAIPIGNAMQAFCDIENATIASLIVSGTAVLWYNANSGGTPLNTSEALVSNTSYYASQTINNCESLARLKVDVLIHKTVVPLSFSEIVPLEVCDSMDDGNDTNGRATFNLRTMEPTLLNGSTAADFNFLYFTDAARSIPIAKLPEAFVNALPNEQTVYVRIENVSNTTCFTDVSFKVQVNKLPGVQPSIIFKNCDVDGVPDGFTDFNLNEIDNIITSGNTSGFNITYHASFTDADMGSAGIKPVPYNNQTSKIIYGRVENSITGCYRVSTINLEVSTTSFPNGFLRALETCDDDAEIDGLHVFDLTDASAQFINEFPAGQNLSVHYYRNLKDAQIEENEITSPTNYINETPFSQILYVRVESDDNGGCFGIGPHLLLKVHPRPEFEVDQSAPFCLNGGSIALNTFNPKGTYSYSWKDANGDDVNGDTSAFIDKVGVYNVVATSAKGCESFPVTFEVKASGISDIGISDVTVLDLSDNNSITIDNTNIGIGDYEFSLDNEFGPFQDATFFGNVFAGMHTLYVRDKNGCGKKSIEVFVMGFPKFFTPNGDGNNDTWNIKGLSHEFLQNSTVFIHDRYGKLIKQLSVMNSGWDGTFNGQNLNSDDYWFIVNLVDDAGANRVFRGHFSLVR